ncbi:MAG TPA: hypothetical protein VIU12_18795 [Chryseolinea sp.]
MSQTASVLSSEQSLYIATAEVSFAPAKSSEAVSTNLNFVFEENGFYIPSTTFAYNDRVSLAFRVKEAFAANFILIKGLIEFNRAKELKFAFNRDEKSFEIDLEAAQLDVLNDFLGHIHALLQKEIQFKAVLKKVIAFENQYKALRDVVYREQQAVVI